MKITTSQAFDHALDQVGKDGYDHFIFGMAFGQCEKVAMGVCPACMMQIVPEMDTGAAALFEKAANIFGLEFHTFPGTYDWYHEIWACLPGYELGLWQGHDAEGEEWHYLRAVACGIPTQNIDLRHHETLTEAKDDDK